MSDLRYPIGTWDIKTEVTPARCEEWIGILAETPALLRAAVQGLSGAQLDTPYRPEGWTVRQVVHHLPDSHMNGYVRFRLAITEAEPTIRPYNESLWAELTDGRTAPIEISLSLLKPLHQRWVLLLESLTDSDFRRKLTHPEIGVVTLGSYLGTYAWHSRHHIAHITALRQRMGWD